MRVGLNLVYLTPQAGGAARYGRELLRSLHEVRPDLQVTAFVSAEAPADLLAAHPQVEWVRYPVTITHGSPVNAARSIASQWFAAAVAARRRRLDVVHGLANITPLVAPGVARVVTLLDLIWLRHPDAMTARDTLAMKATALPSVRRADRVIAISEAAREDILATLRLDPARVDVTLLGIRLEDLAPPAPEAVVRERLELGDARVLLCVAQKRTHKNLEAIVRALPSLPGDIVAVLPGAHTPHEDRLRAVAAELGVAGRLRLPGWLDEDELEGLYALASAFVLPSFEEGFGLPILEAMRRDLPVACSDRSSMPEVAGGGAELFDPHRPEDLARAVGVLLASPERRAELVARGRERCRELTWERTARATLESYERAISSR